PHPQAIGGGWPSGERRRDLDQDRSSLAVCYRVNVSAVAVNSLSNQALLGLTSIYTRLTMFAPSPRFRTSKVPIFALAALVIVIVALAARTIIASRATTPQTAATRQGP